MGCAILRSKSTRGAIIRRKDFWPTERKKTGDVRPKWAGTKDQSTITMFVADEHESISPTDWGGKKGMEGGGSGIHDDRGLHVGGKLPPL